MAELFVKYNCTNCQDDITGIRVHCAKCTSFDLCLQCFTAGAEIGEHRRDHAYQFMDTGTTILSIFRGKGAWSAREELRLLDAIEKYGFGNWEDISKHIETKSAEDAKEEYVSKFLDGTIGRHTWTPAQSERPKLEDHTANEDNGPLGTNAVQKLPPLDVTPEEAAQLGYMPNREGFEWEYDPSAEQLVSSLTLNLDDDETDLALKLAQFDIYTRRLRERARRKRLVQDYQLVANFFRNNNNKSRYKREQREFRDRFRVFAQFYTAQEYESILASIERERELRIRLAELYRYRWNGLTRMDECVHFEQHAAAAQHKNTGPYGHGRTDNPTTGNRHGSYLHSPHNKKTEIASENEKNSSSTGQKHMHHTGDQIYSDGSSLSKSYLDSCRGLSGHLSSQTTSPTATPTAAQPSYQIHQQQQQQHQQQQQQQQQSANTVAGSGRHQNNNGTGINLNQTQIQPLANSNQQQQNQPQSLQHLGENLLSKNERQLCNFLNLPPTSYISLKMVFLSGAPLPAGASTVESTVRKYLIKAGWLKH